MSTTITVTYDNKDYLLEYTRNIAKQMEQQGFVFGQVSEKPATMVPLLVYGAFMKHNKGIKRALVDEIYEHIIDKIGDDGEGFVQTLMEMYAEAVKTLTDSESSDKGNAAVWTVTRG